MNLYMTDCRALANGPGVQIRFLHVGGGGVVVGVIGKILSKFAISRVWGHDF